MLNKLKFSKKLIFKWITLLISILVLFYHTYDIMMVIHDDIQLYTMTQTHQLFDMALSATKNVGRIPQLWNTILLGIPFLANSVVVYKIFQFGSLLFDGFTLYYLLKNHIDKNLGYLAVVLLFAFSTLPPYYNLYISYAFCHQIPIGFLLLSFNFYLEYFKTKKNIHLILTIIFYLFSSMIYEAFILFIIIHFCIYLNSSNIINCNKSERFNNFKKSMFDFLPICIFIGIYCTIYFVYRIKHTSNYEGVTLSFDEPFLSLKIIYTYAISPFPSFQFFDMVGQNKLSLMEFFSRLNIISCLKCVLVCSITYYIVPKIKYSKQSLKILLISLICIFIPNVIIAFTPRYINLEKRGFHGYIVSFYSYFFLIIVFITVIYMIYNLIKNENGKNIFLVCSSFSVLILCLMADVTSDFWHDKYSKDFLKCKTFDSAVSSDFITQLPENTDVYIPDNIGIHGLMSYTNNYSLIYRDTPVSFHNKYEELNFQNDTAIMRYKCDFHAMIVGYVTPDLTTNTIYVSIPNDDTQDIILTLVDGSIITYPNCKDGDILTSEIAFNLS